MAEIPIEKKKPVWPWIVGILAILLIIFLIFIFSNGNDDDFNEDDTNRIDSIEQTDTENLDRGYPENAVGEYLYYIEEEYNEESEEEHNNREAMEKLAAAVEEKTRDLQDRPGEDLEEISGISRDRDTARAEIDTAKTSRGSMAAEELKRTGEIIVNALEELQEKHFPELSGEVEALRRELDALNETGEDDEPEKVKSFFNQAADVLREMPVETTGTTISRQPDRDNGR